MYKILTIIGTCILIGILAIDIAFDTCGSTDHIVSYYQITVVSPVVQSVFIPLCVLLTMGSTVRLIMISTSKLFLILQLILGVLALGAFIFMVVPAEVIVIGGQYTEQTLYNSLLVIKYGHFGLMAWALVQLILSIIGLHSSEDKAKQE
eukprot:TRINITY_DN2039_c3_g1_i1.p1 TRINITY_DN2039_c3_g1~~TRINITY_DN2039_c3_g1_i1.p1  ORF type:complete len:149 (+),score=10.15 TRINITY_DN2039_c3_g1_i1:56-502(+)